MTEMRLLQRSAQPWKPDEEQFGAVKRLIENAVQALLLDPGAGKTSISLAAFVHLKKKGVAQKALVIAPLRPCYLVWPAEVDKWQQFEHLTYTVLHGNDKELRLEDDVDLYIINPEGLNWLFGVETFTKKSGKKGVRLNLERFLKIGIDTLIVDELTKFAEIGSNRSQMMDAVIQFFQRRWGLTGSPAANGLMKLFGQIRTLDEGSTFGRFITNFRTKFFKQHPFKAFQWDIKTLEKDGFDGEKAIYEAIKPLAYRVEMKNSKTPVGIPLRVDVEMPEKAKKLYKMVEDDMFALLDFKETGKKRKDVIPITAANAGVALGKCRQIASGAVYPDKGFDVKGFTTVSGSRPYVMVHDAKMDALAERLDEMQGQPYLLGYEFQHDLDRILKRWPKTPYFTSDMAEAKKLEAKWNAGDVPLLLGHPQSIGHGLNLQQSSRHVGWFSQTWDYELYDQFIRRVMRRGNPFSKVYIDHFITLGTVDELIYQVSSIKGTKAGGQQRLFDALKVEKRRRSK